AKELDVARSGYATELAALQESLATSTDPEADQAAIAAFKKSQSALTHKDPRIRAEVEQFVSRSLPQDVGQLNLYAIKKQQKMQEELRSTSDALELSSLKRAFDESENQLTETLRTTPDEAARATAIKEWQATAGSSIGAKASTKSVADAFALYANAQTPDVIARTAATEYNVKRQNVMDKAEADIASRLDVGDVPGTRKVLEHLKSIFPEKVAELTQRQKDADADAILRVARVKIEQGDPEGAKRTLELAKGVTLNDKQATEKVQTERLLASTEVALAQQFDNELAKRLTEFEARSPMPAEYDAFFKAEKDAARKDTRIPEEKRLQVLDMLDRRYRGEGTRDLGLEADDRERVRNSTATTDPALEHDINQHFAQGAYGRGPAAVQRRESLMSTLRSSTRKGQMRAAERVITDQDLTAQQEQVFRADLDTHVKENPKENESATFQWAAEHAVGIKSADRQFETKLIDELLRRRAAGEDVRFQLWAELPAEKQKADMQALVETIVPWGSDKTLPTGWNDSKRYKAAEIMGDRKTPTDEDVQAFKTYLAENKQRRHGTIVEGKATTHRIGDIVERGGKKWKVVKYDKDGMPMVDEVR
ncbi:MAG: hypothetical protein IMZ50_03560, partial [Candidatus Atribacteria bacterium]|nr:hypothetical protein [Candidatus Atribacteria bacterium]